jgi:hypothetical protein
MALGHGVCLSEEGKVFVGTQEHLDRAHENGHKVFADLLRFVDDVIIPRLREEGLEPQTEHTALMWGATMATAILNNRAVTKTNAPVVAVHVTSMMASHCAEGVWPEVARGEIPVGFFKPAFFTEAKSLSGEAASPIQERTAKQIADNLFAQIAAETRAAREAQRVPAPALSLRERYRRAKKRKEG